MMEPQPCNNYVITLEKNAEIKLRMKIARHLLRTGISHRYKTFPEKPVLPHVPLSR